MPTKYTLEIGLGTLIKITLFILGLFLLYQVLNIVGALLLAVVIASAIEPLIRWATSYHIPRALAVIFFYLAIFISFTLAFYIIIPTFAEDLRNFVVGLPSLVEDVIKELNERIKTATTHKARIQRERDILLEQFKKLSLSKK